jgi:hypothetical protein
MQSSYDVSRLQDEKLESGFWYAIAAGLLLVVAGAIRFGALDTTLFEDEVWVANLAHNGNYAPHTYATPPLFYGMERWWVGIRGMSDVALRELPAFFGVALCALPFAAPRPLRVRMIWALLLAFSSPLLFYSSRLKQYTLEAFVVTLLIVLLLHALEHDSPALWMTYLGLAVAAVMTLYTPVFIVSASAVVVCCRKRRVWILAGFAVVGAAFALAWSLYMAPGPTTPLLHGDMEQFFTMNGRWINSPTLLTQGTLHWTGQALNLVSWWWAVLPPLILFWVVRDRDWAVVLLAALPVIAVCIASAMHIYPYGEVRLMIFCFPALFLVIAESLIRASRRLPLVLLVLVPFIFKGIARDTYNSTYMHVENLRGIIATVANNHQPGEPVFADPSYAAPLHYYVPRIRSDLRAVSMSAPSSPGWYVQPAGFKAANATLIVRTRHVVAMRVR